MNPLAQQLLNVINYWQRKCSLIHLELDAQDYSLNYDYRDGCDCTLIGSGEKTKRPYPMPVTNVMVYLLELLDLPILADDAIDLDMDSDPYFQDYSFVFNFTNNSFTILLNYSYLGVSQELNSVRTSNDQDLFEIFNDLLRDGVRGKWRVDFNGSGDSGYIDDNMTSMQYSDARTISESLSDYLNDFLESRHNGWEINEGSYGFFIIDIDKKTIELDYTEMESRNDETTIYESSIDELIQTISVGEKSVD